MHRKALEPHEPDTITARTLVDHDDAIAAILSAIRQDSQSGRVVRASCARPASATQRRDSGSPSGLYESVATSLWQPPIITTNESGIGFTAKI